METKQAVGPTTTGVLSAVAAAYVAQRYGFDSATSQALVAGAASLLGTLVHLGARALSRRGQ